MRDPHHALRDMIHLRLGVPGALVSAPGIADATDLARMSLNASILRHETQGTTGAAQGGADAMFLQEVLDAIDRVRVRVMTIRHIRVHGAAEAARDVVDMMSLH
jgi:hypothetical protein